MQPQFTPQQIADAIKLIAFKTEQEIQSGKYDGESKDFVAGVKMAITMCHDIFEGYGKHCEAKSQEPKQHVKEEDYTEGQLEEILKGLLS